MYNRIFVHNVNYNGLTFVNSPKNIAGCSQGVLVLKEFGFFEVPTQTSIEKYAMRHGEYVSPTMKKNRIIKILFDIVAPDEKTRWQVLKKVQRAFSPASNPSPLNPELWKKLSFMDVEGETWETETQILKGLQLSDFANEKWVGLSVDLITKTPNISSQVIHTMSDTNRVFGFKLGTNLPLKMQYGGENTDGQGILDVPLNLSITAIKNNATPLNLLNIFVQSKENNSRRLLKIKDTDLQLGDTIQIDGEKKLIWIEKQGVKSDITGLATLNSLRPILTLGENTLTVDCGVTSKVLEIEWKRRDQF